MTTDSMDLHLEGATVYLGDALARLRERPDGSAQMCVTSPPYYGLRDYGHDGQIGLEETPEAYIAKLVEVFREVRRVLADDGTLWVNIGDSYCSRPNGSIGKESRLQGEFTGHTEFRRAHAQRKNGVPDGLKHKDLIGIPWMLAFALRDDGAASPAHMRLVREVIATVTASYDCRDQWPDRLAALVERLEQEHIDANRGGWYLRQEIIWNKPNPMPESVTDRCTKAHESLFLLSKSPRYYFDHEAIKEPAVSTAPPGNKAHRAQSAYEGGDEHHRTKGGLTAFAERARSKANSFRRDDSKRAQVIPGQTVGTHRPDREESTYDLETRNRRSVWTIATKPYKGAHFAVFPPALVEPCILAGSRPGDVVLDVFNGSGTTGQVALEHGRQYAGFELNADYIKLTEARLSAVIAARAARAARAAEIAYQAAQPKQVDLFAEFPMNHVYLTAV